MDHLDVGSPKEKRWAEFRISFASPRLQLAILEDFGADAEAYLDQLESRWYAAELHAEQLKKEDPDYDGDWLLFARNDRDATFIQGDVALEITQQLFPDGHDASDLYQATLGLLTVGFYASIESFAIDHGIKKSGAGLSNAIGLWLRKERSQPDLEATVSDRLADCEATRNVYAHNRGVVDPKFVDRVKNNRFVVGERRRLSTGIVEDFADAVWRAARRIRDAV